MAFETDEIRDLWSASAWDAEMEPLMDEPWGNQTAKRSAAAMVE
jgi:hypothetical protein